MMKLIFNGCVLILALFLLAGCSSQKEKPEPEGYFATRIDENDEKLFQYTLDIQLPDDGNRGTKRGGKCSEPATEDDRSIF
jgi:hypothetical protein